MTLKLIDTFKQLFARKDKYDRVRLSEKSIKVADYKRHFGGGSEGWETRGAFQLALMKAIGLKSHHSFLDIGCGPLRAGTHFIKYLEEGRYCGFDSNADFINIGRSVVEGDPNLAKKRPQIEAIRDFDVAPLGFQADFALAFSVLNHCSPERRRYFFEKIPAVMTAESKIYLTHINWFQENDLHGTKLRKTRLIEPTADISNDLNPGDWGWPESMDLMILELMLA